MNMAHGGAALPDRQTRGTVKHLAKIYGGVGAGQIDRKQKRLGKRFVQIEPNHLERICRRTADEIEGESQIRLDGHGKLGDDRGGCPVSTLRKLTGDSGPAIAWCSGKRFCAVTLRLNMPLRHR